MDLQPSHTQEATSSSSNSTPDIDTTEPKTLRSSARVKAAKQKSQDKEQFSTGDLSAVEKQSSSSQHLPDSSISRATRAKRPREGTSGKGKAKETAEGSSRRRTRRNVNTTSNPPLTIQEPVKDPKGKKRAVPEPSSDEENTASTSSKRSRTTSYSLRSQTSTNQSPDMPKKTRSVSKGKMAAKAKAMVAAAGSSQQLDADIEMADSDYKHEHELDHDDHEMAVDEDEDGCEDDRHQSDEYNGGGDGDGDGGDGDGDGDQDDDDDNDEGEDDDGGVSGLGGGSAPGGLDEAAALAIFGDYRQFGSYMMSLSSRLKTMLNNIKMTADPTTRLLTLQELSELLSISTEDTLAGSFQVEQFVKELVKILGGRGVDEDDDDEGDGNERDEDLAAALALSAGGTFQGDENLESQVLACRCLANLMEALPGVAHTVVYHGAIPVLCSKLIEISYIDLAEQTLSTMEKISEEFPSSIVREGGLSALLNYLDFFSIAVQRTALQAASNCCRNVSSEHFPQILGVWPIIRNCLSYSDQRLVEFACLCVIRVIDSYHRSSVENLEALVDAELIRAVLQLLLPAGGSPMIAPNTFTLLLRALATSARASPKITVALLEADVVDTLYQILTGVLPSAVGGSSEQGDSTTGQGLGGGVADMTVMENLAHRPKDQVEETLSLISELMPPLPKDGVFDYKSYTEKSLSRMIKAKAKAERAAARAAAQAPLIAAGLIAPAPVTPTPDEAPADAETPQEGETANATPTPAHGRTEILRSKASVVARFMQLTVPILIDVYAASVNTPVRVKALTGLLKAVSFLDADGVKEFVPVASFASSILSSKDQPQLVIGALQLVDLLLTKDPLHYKGAFRREGVFHEIEVFAARTLISSKSKEKGDKDRDKDQSEATSSDSTPAPPTSVPTIPGYKKLSSLSLDPDDAITLRARIIKFKHLSGDDEGEGESTLSGLRTLVERLQATNATEKELTEALWDLANLFASPHTSVSSFELVQSGLVDGLLRFTVDADRQVSVARRKELLLEALVNRRNKLPNGAHTPFATLVKKLQESLTRMESFEVVTVSQSSDDSKRSSPSLLARQLRLRLVSDDDSGVPRSLHNIVVSIHAIATFQALHDYLRPRVAGGIGSTSSRLSGMLAALAASGFAGPSSRLTGDSSQPEIPPPPASSFAAAMSEPSGPTVTRRRSQRLSAKKGSSDSTTTGDETADNATATTSEPAASTSSAPPEPPAEPPAASEAAPSETLVAEFSDEDEEIDAEVFEDEDMDPDNSISDKTVTLSVAEDGSKVEAQTPDGTRVATPAQRDVSSAAGPSASSLARPSSYAAALKAKPTDWHLEFAMDDHVLPLDLTIYGAIHQHEMRKKTGPLPPSMLWQGVYTIKFKKVSGPVATPDDAAETSSKARSASPTLSCLAEDTPHAKILRLLRVLHNLNTAEAERLTVIGDKRSLPETAFINNKLTAKLTRQLEEPMIVASSCLPDWALDLPQHFPFLFPFATRYNFLQSTSFGYARLILKWQSQQQRGQDSSRRDDGIGFLGRLHRQKVRISRKHVLESAVKVFEMYGSSSSVLEVEYFEEVGTGLGPTLEFYSLVSKEFARKDLKIWRDADHNNNTGTYVNHPTGLYPAPLSTEDIASDGGQKKLHVFRVIGQFVAKAMLDSRIIDLSFNKAFLKLVLGEEVPLTIASLKLIDLDLANSLVKLLNIANGSNQDTNNKVAQKLALLEVTVDDLALDFTLPGYDVELRPGGRDIAVTSENAHEYVQEVLNAILGKGAAQQAKAFRDGFSKVFPINDLQPFSIDELVMLFGNTDEDWSPETLGEALKADHGFNPESRAIRDLIGVMAEYDPQSRREYLQFITGSPKLPIGGFRGLNPPFTVVRKPHEAPLTADDYLPSVMTCVNYLKLPEYSSKAVMKEKLRIAMKEGVGSFHLS
ncbi:Ubiquitin fusion degradation protein 4 [Marasmius tenuissimus]|uniref:HECT-type E3 ubiquitin transferase n=1 Tax=Marasmius tenuissimus TaxID=585030 RepID=A0ABR2ZCU0_9AGAR